jgi:polyferredoxin
MLMKYIKPLIQIIFLALFIFLMSSSKTLVWFIIFAVSLIAALLFGRVYCGYICPMNTLMQPVEWLSKKLHIQTSNIPKFLITGIVAWIALGVTIIFMIVSKKVLNVNIPILIVWLILSVVITIKHKPEVFHNYICPFGLLQKLAGRLSVFSHRVTDYKCIGCRVCEEVCPTNSIKVEVDKYAVINKTYCLQCSECKNVCPENAIIYKRKDEKTFK